MRDGRTTYRGAVVHLPVLRPTSQPSNLRLPTEKSKSIFLDRPSTRDGEGSTTQVTKGLVPVAGAPTSAPQRMQQTRVLQRRPRRTEHRTKTRQALLDPLHLRTPYRATVSRREEPPHLVPHPLGCTPTLPTAMWGCGGLRSTGPDSHPSFNGDSSFRRSHRRR